jgi:Predicted unusual protein kinase
MSDDHKRGPRVPLNALRTGLVQRNFALTRLGLGAGSQIVAHSLLNIFRGSVERNEADREFYRRQARVLADELGQLKGSVMKAGQMLSLYGQYFLPEEAVAVLAELQDDSQPVAWRVLAPVLERDLGVRRLRELEIEEQPIGAASLGQVHRARRRSDGLELAVKIQYPGVARAIDSDVRTLSTVLLATRLAPRGLDLSPVFAEVREMLHHEVDYRRERRFTEAFGERLADDSRFVVPQVIGDYCGDHVLTTTFEAGVGVRHPDVQRLSLARRNRLAQGFVDLFLRELFDWHDVQSDPHFGNYRFRLGRRAADDRIVLLDFGATRRYEAAFVDAYAEIVGGAMLRDPARIEHGALGIGLMNERTPPEVRDAYAAMCETIVEPFRRGSGDAARPELFTRSGAYRWGKSDLPMRVANIAARNSLSVHFRIPPREIVFLHRRLAGVFIMCAALQAENATRASVLEALHLTEDAGAE